MGNLPYGNAASGPMNKKSMVEVLTSSNAATVDLALTALGVIPAFGIAIGLLQSVDDYRARIQLAKMEAFIRGTRDITTEDVRGAEERLANSAERELMAETLLLAIESYTALDKCEIVGVLYLAFLKGGITAGQLRRLTHAIDTAFVDDLNDFLMLPGQLFSAPQDERFLYHLLRAGLTEIREERPLYGNTSQRMSISQLGADFRQAYWSIRPPKRETIPEKMKHLFNDDGALVIKKSVK